MADTTADTTTDDAPAAAFDRAAVEAFLIHEAGLLDDRRFDEWRDLFEEDGYYWVPLHPDQKNPEDEVSLFFDDRNTMASRFARLAHPRIHAQSPPTRALRMVGNVRLADTDAPAGCCDTVSNLIMADYRQGEQRVFAGKVRHRLRRTGDGFSIVWKKVELINADDVFELIAVPF